VSTYLFAWNPTLWNWPTLQADIRQLKRRGHLDRRWNTGRVRHIEPGSRAFMVRVGVPPKGIFGSGVTLTSSRLEAHWRPEKAAVGEEARYLTLRLDALFLTPQVTYDDLAVPPFARFRWGVRTSGVRVPSALAARLEEQWEARIWAPRARRSL